MEKTMINQRISGASLIFGQVRARVCEYDEQKL